MIFPAYLVFDIGGTSTKYALFKKNKLIFHDSAKTLDSHKLLNLLENITKTLMKKYKIKKLQGLGVSAPGYLNSEKLALIAPPNLQNIKNLSLTPLKKYTKKIILEKDANCAALGALLLHQKSKNLVCLTLGTGLGCGIIINKKIYKGKSSASEFAHSLITPKSPASVLEDYVSIRGLKKIAKKYNLPQNPIEISKLASEKNIKNKNQQNHKNALKTYNEFAEYLSTAIANISNILDPELIVLTGGLSNASRFFIKQTKIKLRKKLFTNISPKILVHRENLQILGLMQLLRYHS